MLDENLFVCFDCEGEPGFYHEFTNNEGFENAPCNECGSGKNTIPLFYLEEMTIPTLQKFLSEMAEQTIWLPLIDLKFKSLKLPGAIKCSHHISQKFGA